MHQAPEEAGTARSRIIARGTLELVVAATLFGVGGLVIFDSRRLGSGWGSDGPQAGYFPFYIGALLCLVSVLIAVGS